MNDFIEKDNLFCDEYRALILCEYTHEMDLLKRLIEIMDGYVQQKETRHIDSFDGTCYYFAKTIVEHSKMAFDNLILGHFYAAQMINRVILENNICMDIIIQYQQKELWKYYFVQSVYKDYSKPDKGISEENQELLKLLYKEHHISPDFLEQRKKQCNGKEKRLPAYIQQNYGWTYKVNKNFNFAGICDLVDKRAYKDFKLMSDYSHGTSVFLKMGGTVSIEHMIGMISSMYIGLYRLADLYCMEFWDEEFDEITSELENIMYDYIEEMEQIYE